MWHAIIMEVEAAAGGGQLALKEVLVHGEPYEYAYEGTREQYARLFDKTGKELPYVLHIDTRGVYAHGMHYHGQTDDGSWHEPVAELSGTGNEGTLIDPTDDDARTISSSDFGDEPIPEADEAKPRHLLADHNPSACALSACAPSACAPSACALTWLPAADAVIRGVCRRSPSSSLSSPRPAAGALTAGALLAPLSCGRAHGLPACSACSRCALISSRYEMDD